MNRLRFARFHDARQLRRHGAHLAADLRACSALGAWLVLRDKKAARADSATSTTQTQSPTSAGPAPVRRWRSTDADRTGRSAAACSTRAAAYQAQNGIVDVDISEYAGYAGLIVANGGLEPNPDSFFARRSTASRCASASARRRAGPSSTTARLRPASPPPTCWPCSAGSSKRWCRRRSASRAAPTWWWSIPASAASTSCKRQGARRLAVQRERVLHPLPRLGGRTCR